LAGKGLAAPLRLPSLESACVGGMPSVGGVSSVEVEGVPSVEVGRAEVEVGGVPSVEVGACRGGGWGVCRR